MLLDKGLIVVIDDSETILDRVKTRLEAEGYRVATSAQTVGAARLLMGANLVILDWYMPGINGTEVLRSFRAAVAKSTTRPQFYLYTSDRTVTANAQSMGFDGAFVNKGDLDSLVLQVGAAMRIAKLKDLANRPNPYLRS